jgi:hypothetical protein
VICLSGKSFSLKKEKNPQNQELTSRKNPLIMLENQPFSVVEIHRLHQKGELHEKDIPVLD